MRAAWSADRALISDVGVFDVFTGQGVPEGKKSLAIEVTLQPREKTLTDAEIEAVAEKDRRRGQESHRRRVARASPSPSRGTYCGPAGPKGEGDGFRRARCGTLRLTRTGLP